MSLDEQVKDLARQLNTAHHFLQEIQNCVAHGDEDSLNDAYDLAGDALVIVETVRDNLDSSGGAEYLGIVEG